MDLRGRTILITRAPSQSEELRAGLERLGARVLECPAIEIVPVEDWAEVDQAISNLNTYDWLIFTSTNAVDYFAPRMAARGVTCTVPIAAVGAATGARLSHWNLTPARIPADFRSEGLLELFPADLRGLRVLLPRAETAREVLPDELRRRGAIVDLITVYRTVRSTAGLSSVRSTLVNEKIDSVAFTSPSAIRFFAEALGDELKAMLSPIPIAVIGPVAEEAATTVGLKASIRAEHATIQDLVEAIRAYFSSRTGST
jgi:uroporphyrinogen III methyltransferase / synthase